MKIWRSLLMVVTLLLAICMPYHANAQTTANQAYNTATTYLQKQVTNPTYGDEWVILALARGEAQVPAGYYETYYNNLVKEVQAKKGVLHQYKYTEYARVILALSAIGKNATNVGGYNLVAKLNDVDSVVWQGVNGPIFALIALDSWNYVSEAREPLLNELLKLQLADGGFTLSGDEADVDLTAMAIQALAPYKDYEKAGQALKRAIACLDRLTANTVSSVESAAQVMTARAALQQDSTATTAQLQLFYHAADGGYKHLLTDISSNGMATEQAAYALAAVKRMQQGKTSLYNMTDTRGSFIDTANNWARDYIEKATALGLLKGYSDGTFRPNNNLTRAQAVSILVRSLKLDTKNPAPFSDLGNMAAATKQEIAAAYEAGIIKYNGGHFNPQQNITRVQLGLMLLRTYNLQGGAFESAQVVAYTDTTKLDMEQQQALAFLAQYGIATGSNGRFNPYNPTTRAQATKMFVQFVKAME